MTTASPLTRARRIVVKVGSALLVDQSTGQVNRPWLETLVEDLLRLRARKQEVVLVSSGAIALGRRELKLAPGALKLEQSQAAAAVGQIALAHIYKELFARSGVTVAQILLTLEDSERPPPLSKCARHAVRTPGARCAAGHQRKRHRRDHRDPLRRQRPARGACRADDQRRLPAAAVGCGRAVYRRPQSRPDRAADPRSPRHHARDRSHGWRIGVGRGFGRHGHQDRRGEDRHLGGLRHGHRRRRATASGAPPRRGRRLQLVPARVQSRERAQAVDRRVAAPERCNHHRCRRAAGAAVGQEPAARRRHRGQRPVQAWRHRERARRAMARKSRAV